ncbi:MAG: 2-C-methyl-D-erythritol 4-phosphate cytidylyltransferase [Ruminococcus sp.]|nr:2-C-methyl-D-erythritol 4-phosphate cytidylyltransferase [Ruminococcus sp.]
MENRPYVTAIIVAAGNSTRMGCGMSKQFIPLLGKPAVGYTLKAFEEAYSISEVVVVCRESDLAQIKEIAENENCTKVKAYVFGGETRSESVSNGIKTASGNTTHYAIHDGARALILPEDINNVVSVALESGAAALVVPVTDTIKIVDSEGTIISTPVRADLRAAQTPQVFEKELYLSALEKTKGEVFTDDCALVETVGAKVKTVIGNYSNIKLTTVQDIPVAEAVLKKRMGRE